jgi:hypothetical protein
MHGPDSSATVRPRIGVAAGQRPCDTGIIQTLGSMLAADDNVSVKTWTDSLPQIPFPYRGLPAGGPWLTQEEAASYLGIGPYHLNALTSVTRRIDMVRTAGRELAVTRASVEAEKKWRTTAALRRKVVRLLKDILRAM